MFRVPPATGLPALPPPVVPAVPPLSALQAASVRPTTATMVAVASRLAELAIGPPRRLDEAERRTRRTRHGGRSRNRQPLVIGAARADDKVMTDVTVLSPLGEQHWLTWRTACCWSTTNPGSGGCSGSPSRTRAIRSPKRRTGSTPSPPCAGS